jgi:hypothetical protein
MTDLFVYALTLALTAAAAGAGAQVRRPSATDAADMAELAAYRLNTATLQKVTAVMQHFVAALETDPKYQPFVAAQKELAALDRKPSRTASDERRMDALAEQLEQMPPEMVPADAATLTDMERGIAAMPHMAEALAKAGLTAREYAKFNLTMLQAGMLAGMKKAGQLRQLPPGASMENVQFMIDHEREIAALSAQMQGR